MKTRLISMTALILTVGLLSTAAHLARAEANKPASEHKTHANKMTGNESLKVCRDGFAAMRSIRAARIAIFDGEPKWAVKLLGKAKRDLNAAAQDPTRYTMGEKFMKDGKVLESETVAMEKNWIPIDGQIKLAETYVATDANAERIKKANEHFKNGRSREGLEELRLGDIGVSFSRVVMPLNGTLAKVDEASKLLEEHKYYEANLALKAAEDGLIVDTIGLITAPKADAPKAK
jgi:hypothetical protein